MIVPYFGDLLGQRIPCWDLVLEVCRRAGLHVASPGDPGDGSTHVYWGTRAKIDGISFEPMDVLVFGENEDGLAEHAAIYIEAGEVLHGDEETPVKVVDLKVIQDKFLFAYRWK